MMKDRQQSIIRPEQEIGGKNPRDFVQALQKILRFHSMLSATWSKSSLFLLILVYLEYLKIIVKL